MPSPYHVVRIGLSPLHETLTLQYDREQAVSLGLAYTYTPCPHPQYPECGGADPAEALRSAEITITFGNPLDRRAIEAMENGKLIVCATVGFDFVDLAAATERGILVANIPLFCADEVADHAVTLLLSCARKLPLLHGHLKAGRWRKDLMAPMAGLKGQVLGLVGCGNIGRRVAERARPFGFQILVSDPYLTEEAASRIGVELVGMEELLKRSDFVSCHTPLNAKTRHLIGEAQLRSMKPTAYLINTSRGPVIDEEVLARALEEGWIGGAGLDVFEKEPLPANSPLLRLDNVVVTPHIAAYSETSAQNAWTHPWDVIRCFLSGQTPPSVVNRSAG